MPQSPPHPPPAPQEGTTPVTSDATPHTLGGRVWTSARSNLMLEALGDFVPPSLPESSSSDLDHEDTCPEDIVRAMCSDAPRRAAGLHPRGSTAAWAAAPSTPTGSARRWPASTSGWRPRCSPPSSAATRSWWGAPRSRSRSGSDAIAEQGMLFAYGATEPEAGSDLGAMTTTADAGHRRRRRRDGVPHQRPQAVDQQRQHRRLVHDPGRGARRPVLVRRGQGRAGVLLGAAGGQARDPAVQHRRPVPRRRGRAGRATSSAASRAVASSRPSRCSATPG